MLPKSFRTVAINKITEYQMSFTSAIFKAVPLGVRTPIPAPLLLNVFCIVCDSALITSIVWNRCPFNLIFIFGNRKKSQGAKLGENAGWRTTTILFSAENCCTRKVVRGLVLLWLLANHKFVFDPKCRPRMISLIFCVFLRQSYWV